jgi:hypothetical protein
MIAINLNDGKGGMAMNASPTIAMAVLHILDVTNRRSLLDQLAANKAMCASSILIVDAEVGTPYCQGRRIAHLE